MGDAHAVGQGSRARAPPAASSSSSPRQCRVRPQLEGHGDHLVPRVERELRRRRAVHAAAHRHERAPRGRRGGSALRRAPPIRAHGGRRPPPGPPRVAWPATRPPSSSDTAAASRCAASKHRRALHQFDHCAAGRLTGAAAGRLEARLRHELALHPQRDPDQVAAGRAAGAPACGASREAPRPRGEGSKQVVGDRRHLIRSPCLTDKNGPSLPLPDRELGLHSQAWVSSAVGHDPPASRAPIPMVLAQRMRTGWRTS